MVRRFGALSCAVVALLTWVLPIESASATTWSSRLLGHTPYTCSDHSLWVKHYVNVGATIYAAATDRCGHFAFVSGTPTGGYHIEKTPFVGYNGSGDAVDAIARDGNTTYFLRRNPRYTTQLEMWSRSSTGRYALARVLTKAVRPGETDDLVVVGGQWTAAWVQLINGEGAIYLASTLAGHGGHAQVVTPKPAGFGDHDPYVVQRTSTDAEVIYRSLAASDDVALHARHVVQGGFSADRVMVHLTGHIAITGRVLQRGSWTYLMVNDYFDSTGTYTLGLISDSGSAAHPAPMAKGDYYGQLAVDPVSGHVFAAVDIFQAGTYPSLLSNATGTWRSIRLPIGTRDIGFDALTAYSSNVAIYYSPASTYQDTVYYQH